MEVDPGVETEHEEEEYLGVVHGNLGRRLVPKLLRK